MKPYSKRGAHRKGRDVNRNIALCGVVVGVQSSAIALPHHIHVVTDKIRDVSCLEAVWLASRQFELAIGRIHRDSHVSHRVWTLAKPSERQLVRVLFRRPIAHLLSVKRVTSHRQK